MSARLIRTRPLHRRRAALAFTVLGIIGCTLILAGGALVQGVYRALSGQEVARLGYTPQRYEATVHAGDGLVGALERYRAVHQAYPEALTELIPEFLPAIQAPLVGSGEWGYTRPEPHRFVLRFFVGPIYESDSYDSAKGKWYSDR